MIVGDDKKFLSALITLKCIIDLKNNKPSHDLSDACKIQLRNNVKNSENLKTIDEAMKHPELLKYI